MSDDEPYTGPSYKPGDPQYEGWGRRDDPVPDSKPSSLRSSIPVPLGAVGRWIEPYPGTDYRTFVPRGGGPVLRRYVGEDNTERTEETKEAGPPAKRSRESS